MPTQVTNVPLVRVYDYLKTSTGASGGNANPISGRTVTLTLAPATTQASSINPVTQLPSIPIQSTVTDGNGYWEAWVVPTDNINPSGMTYLVDDGYRTYKINPVAAGIPGIGWQSSAIVASTPQSLVGVGGNFLPAGTEVLGTLKVDGSAQIKGPGPWIDVTHPAFGASTIGTAAANTAAIHAARDAGGVGALLIFPGLGVFTVNPLSASVNMQRWQVNPGATVQLAGAQVAPIVTVSGTGVWITGGGVFDGNRNNQVGTAHGMTIGPKTTIDGVTVQNCRGYGITANVASGCVIRSCTVTGTLQDAISGYCQNQNVDTFLVADNTIDMSGENPATTLAPGINIVGVLAGVAYTKVRIRDNTILMSLNPTSGQVICIQTFGNVKKATISGNVCHQGAMGVSCDHTNESTVSQNIVVGCNGTGGIELATSSQCTVTGNAVDGGNLASHGIILDGGAPYSNNNTISGNAVTNCLFQLIMVNAGQHETITGNAVFMTQTTHGIYLQQSAFNTVSGNTIDGGGTGFKGISLDTTDRTAVSGNVISNMAQNGIWIYAATAVTLGMITITGNTVFECNVYIATALSGGATLAADCRVWGNDWISSGIRYLIDWFDFANNIVLQRGTGTPNGAQTGGVGSIYLRTDGTSGTTMYVKETGTGNTGWVPRAGTDGLSISSGGASAKSVVPGLIMVAAGASTGEFRALESDSSARYTYMNFDAANGRGRLGAFSGAAVLPMLHEASLNTFNNRITALKDILRSVQTPAEATLVSGVDATAGEMIEVTLTANRVVGLPLNPATGQELTFSLIQGGVGAFTVGWNAGFKVSWSDAGNATGKRSTVTFWYDGANWNQKGAQVPYV